MPKKRAKATKVTLKIAKKAIRMTPDGHRRLTLCNIGITIFPKCLLKLTNVDELDLSRNMIQKLPADIGKFSSLQWLDLHSNKLESLPESIGNLTGLTYLNLCNNRLTSAGLPSTLGCLTSLRSLNLGMNRLDTLPTSMAALDSLQELGLFDNLFITLPEFVNILPNLTKLNTKRNPLTYMSEDREDMKEKSKAKETVYLVHESSVCTTHLKTCEVHRQRCLRGGRGGGRGEGGTNSVQYQIRMICRLF
uniref:Leucine rich repeat containing 18a n=1 Tax=Sphaeramia orbicularis TaxID=375764 RepID=A0A673ADR8_9TELE